MDVTKLDNFISIQHIFKYEMTGKLMHTLKNEIMLNYFDVAKKLTYARYIV